MGKIKVLAIAAIVIVLAGGGYLCIEQIVLNEEIQVDLTLKLRAVDSDYEFSASYHWGAKEIEISQTTQNIEWNKRTSTATVHTSGDLTEELKDYLSEIEIESDYFSARTDGCWSLSMQKKLFQGVFIGLRVDGDNTTIDHITPSLSVDVLPASLSYALKGLGIDSLDVIVTISVSVPGQIVSQYLRNCYEVAISFVDLTNDLVGELIGTISV